MPRKVIIGLVVVLALIVVFFAASAFFRLQSHPNSSSGQATPMSRSNVLESSSRYLKENGIDCRIENTNATYRSLAIDPKDPKNLYIGIEGRGVYRSSDQGRTWAQKIKGLTVYPDSNDKRYSCFPDLSYIYIDPTNTKRLLLVIGDITSAYVDWPYGETGGIWESLDGAENWQQLLKTGLNVASSGDLAVDSRNPKVMYYPVNPDKPTFREAPIKESLNSQGSVYRTEDGGQNWQELTMPMLPNLQATRIFIDPTNSNHLIFLTQSHDHVYHDDGRIDEIFLEKQHGIIESIDGGKTFTSWESRFPQPYGALFDGDIAKGNFNHLFVRPFLFGEKFAPDKTVQKSFYSTDGGKSLKQTSSYIWTARYSPHDLAGDQMLGFIADNATVVESRDGGATWHQLAKVGAKSGVRATVSNFAWDPTDSQTVYMSADHGLVWQSTNGGKSWREILSLETLPL